MEVKEKDYLYAVIPMEAGTVTGTVYCLGIPASKGKAGRKVRSEYGVSWGSIVLDCTD
jgi:hypothetical protein